MPESFTTALPPSNGMWHAFTPAHLQHRLAEVKVDTPLLVVR